MLGTGLSEIVKMKLFKLIFLLHFVLGYSQEYTQDQKAVFIQAKKLDSLMENNDAEIVNLFCEDVSFGHSNGWVQDLDEFKKDFDSEKVRYKKVSQLEISESKQSRNAVSLRRSIKVEGLYQNQDFEMKLALLEIWIKKKSVWKLWSRQSVEIKP